MRKPTQASVSGLGVQRLKLAGRGLSLLLGGLHPNVRHLQPCITGLSGIATLHTTWAAPKQGYILPYKAVLHM